MNRRNFLSLTSTFTGGLLILPEFLHAIGNQNICPLINNCVVFIQMNGGNDGLNTFIPFENPIYYDKRPNIAIAKNNVLSKNNGMGWHPALSGLAQIQQNGHLSVIQNVGYPNPNRSHFRSQEIWQTASDSNTYYSEGWLGKLLDFQCKENNPVAGVNIDSIDNLILKGKEPNFITVKDPSKIKTKSTSENTITLSENPQLDFVRKIAQASNEGGEQIQKALDISKNEITYPNSQLGKNLAWISRLIKGNLNSKVYVTSINGFDTHDNQLASHQNKLKEVNDAVISFYNEMKASQLLSGVTIVLFSEFGRRVSDNGNGTDHGTAAPMFVIGGNTKGKVLGNNPDLSNLDEGDLIHEIDFRSVFASIVQNKLSFDPKQLNIKNEVLKGLF